MHWWTVLEKLTIGWMHAPSLYLYLTEHEPSVTHL
jgi:hypothetical protein